MEDKNNIEKNEEKNNEIKINEQENNDNYFINFLLNNKNIPILKESLLYQKKFINFIKYHIEKLKQSTETKENIIILNNILTYLIDNYEIFGISFFSLLINENKFIKDIIFLFYNKNIFKNEIKLLIQKIIDIFNFNYEVKEINNPLEKYYKDLIDYGIIEQKNLNSKISEKKSNLIEEQHLYININCILLNIKKYQDLENNVKKKALEYIESQINLIKKKLKFLKINNNISNASIEYYQETLEEINNLKNKEINNINIKNKEKGNDNDSDSEKNVSEEKKEDENEEIIDEFDENGDFEDDEVLTYDEIIEEIKEFRKKPLKERIYFFKDEQIINDENEHTEFKNYYFPLGKVQKDELMRQFCSFMNSDGGRLYIGINDKKIIKGVIANERIINYVKKMNDLMEDFCPKINIKEFMDFYAIPVRNNHNGKIIDNLFVFKIIIRKGDPAILYSTSSKGLNCSIRLQGQCANLTAEEIHRTILERNKLKYSSNYHYKSKNEDEDDYEMNDPSPFITQRILDNEAKKVLVKKFDKDATNNKDKDEDGFILVGDKNKGKENFKNKMNIKTKKKKKNKRKNSNKNGIYRVEFSNIDQSIDESKLNGLFGGYNYENFKFFKVQNGQSNGYMDFMNEKDADDLIHNFNNMTLGNRLMHLNKISFNL